jgi:nicotinamidase-related amidase
MSAPDPKPALLIVDMSVEQFTDVNHNAEMVIENCCRLAESDFFQLVIDCRLWIDDPSQTSLSWVIEGVGTTFAKANSSNAKIVGPLQDLPNLTFVGKTNYSCFSNTPLLETLHREGITHVCVCGINTDQSIFATAMDSFVHKFETYVVTDAVSSSRGQEAHEEGLQNLARHFGPDVCVECSDLLGDEEEYEEEIIEDEEYEEEEIIEEEEEEEIVQEDAEETARVAQAERNAREAQEARGALEIQRQQMEVAKKKDQERLAAQRQKLEDGRKADEAAKALARGAEQAKLEEESRSKEFSRKLEEEKLTEEAKQLDAAREASELAIATEEKKIAEKAAQEKKAAAAAPAKEKKAAAAAPAKEKKAVAAAPASKEKAPKEKQKFRWFGQKKKRASMREEAAEAALKEPAAPAPMESAAPAPKKTAAPAPKKTAAPAPKAAIVPAPAPVPAPTKANWQPKTTASVPAPAKTSAPGTINSDSHAIPRGFSSAPWATKQAASSPVATAGSLPVGNRRFDASPSDGVASRLKDLKSAGLLDSKGKKQRMVTPKIITDTKETWDKHGNCTVVTIKYITEIDGSKRTEKTTQTISASKAPKPV